MIRRLLFAFLFVALSCAPAAARKVALVIGNGAYRSTVALANPVGDARAMADKLNALGFEVVSGYDEDLSAMQQTVGDFARKVIGADVALLFYAGHGIQVHGDNYLIPVDAKFEDETALDFETLPVNFIMRQMSRDVRVRVIILDACRNNPLARGLARAMGPSRAASVAEGLAEIKIEDPGEGTVIAFATSPGDVAYDGDSSHSPFTEALLKHIDTPDTPIQNVMTRVTRDVYAATKQRQRPWVNASLIGEVYLNETEAFARAAAEAENAGTAGTSTSAAPALTEAPKADSASIAWDREKSLFESAQKAGAVEDYRAYLEAYPNGQFAEIARNFIARAETAPAAAEPALRIAALPPPDATSAEPAERAAAALAAPAEGTAGPIQSNGGPELGTSESEAALGWDRAKRREVQVRLELSGQELGSADGSFGPRTRQAVSAWQSANGFVASGFFTAEQFDQLVSQTESAFAKWQASEAQSAAAPRHAAAKASSANTKPLPVKKAARKTAAPRQPAQTAQRPSPAPYASYSAASPPQWRSPRNIEGDGYSGSSDTHCLAHPGHRVVDGVCLY